MSGAHILVACELTSYREAIAAALRELRPEAEVFEAVPEDLDREVERLGPDLVVCSVITEFAKSRVSNWVELYPDCEAHSVVSLRGEVSVVGDIELPDLLSIVDRSQPVSRRG